MKTLKLVLLSGFLIGAFSAAMATEKGGVNTFFVGADCGAYAIQNPSHGGNPYMQNTQFSVILNEANGKSSFHTLELSIGSDDITLSEQYSKNSYGLRFQFDKNEVFSDSDEQDESSEVKATVTAKSGPLAGNSTASCKISWSEVIGSQVINH